MSCDAIALGPHVDVVFLIYRCMTAMKAYADEYTRVRTMPQFTMREARRLAGQYTSLYIPAPVPPNTITTSLKQHTNTVIVCTSFSRTILGLCILLNAPMLLRLRLFAPANRASTGSSARNAMIYQRPTNESMQIWADQVGDQNYTFQNLLPYYEKSINFTTPNAATRFANSTPSYDQTVLGDNTGPLSVSFPNSPSAFSTWAMEGLKQIGLSVIEGFQSGQLAGSSYSMFTIDGTTMTRSTSETAFLQSSLSSDAYHVYVQALAKKILFDSTNTATGVLVDTQGFEYTLFASKEVILSAGAFGSPQLLQVSGIGPAETLTSLGIDVIADSKCLPLMLSVQQGA